jgi:hypothetical protein
MELVDELSAFICLVENNIEDVSPILKLKLQILLRCINLGLIGLVLRHFDADLIQEDLLLCHRFVHEGVRPGRNLLDCVEQEDVLRPTVLVFVHKIFVAVQLDDPRTCLRVQVEAEDKLIPELCLEEGLLFFMDHKCVALYLGRINQVLAFAFHRLVAILQLR